jgi:hypothetical protein
MMINAYAFFIRRNIRRVFASIGLIFLSSVPIVFEHATIGYANLPFTMYIVLGVLYGLEGIFDNRPGALLMSGIHLGLAAWTRQEGLLFSLLIVVTLSLNYRLTRKGMLKLCPLVVPLGIFGISWVIFSRVYLSDGLITRSISEAWLGISQGQFHLESVYRILRFGVRQIVTPSIWGLLFPVSLILILMAGVKRLAPRADVYLFGVVTITLIIGAAVFLFYYAVSFSQLTLEWWLSTSFNRMMLPVGILVGFLAVLSIGSSPLLCNDHK